MRVRILLKSEGIDFYCEGEKSLVIVHRGGATFPVIFDWQNKKKNFHDFIKTK